MTQDNTLDILGIDEIEAENTAIDDIDSEIVNLIFVAVDQSGSMYPYRTEMQKCLADFKDALLSSKEADEMLIARANFNLYKNIEIGGYKGVDEFDVNYSATGGTPLYDVIIEGAKRLNDYMTYLKNQGMRVKAVFAIFSDGDDTTSGNTAYDAKGAIEDLNTKEVTTAFISFGSEAKDIADNLQFRNKLEVGSSASELRKAFDVLSKSVIESSKSVLSNQDDFFTI